MKKIPDEMDNPIDNVLIKLADDLCPLFKRTGHTPNMITTYSLIFGLVSMWCLYKGHMWGFGISYMVSYFFDCMDGHFARKYKMTSKGGDLYDHIKDISIYILIVYIVYKKYRKVIKATDIAILLFFLFINCIHLGCQQKQQDDGADNETLDNFQKLCPNKDMIYATRYFGLGTFVVISILLVVMINGRCNTLLANQ
jgi:phosphatidylglycerophosphate synthase